MSAPISIIIVTYNSESTIEKCLESVIRNSDPEDEILVIDNASLDRTCELIEPFTASCDRVRLIRNAENTYYTAAANQGIEASKHEYCLFLNPDTVLYPHWKPRMLKVLSFSGIAAVGPVSNCVAGRQYIGWHLPETDRQLTIDELDWVVSECNSGTFETTKLLIGFCLLVHRSIFDELGRFDPDLVMGGEDLEFSWRLRQAGHLLGIARDVFVFHAGSASENSPYTSDSSALRRRCEDVLRSKILASLQGEPIPSPWEMWGAPIFDCR